MTERTEKIKNLEIELTFDDQTGEITHAVLWENRHDIEISACFDLRPYKGRGVLFGINPLGWKWDKSE